jgi:TetR/AcrR family transcriptional repressor of mexCD-oprJ operon
MRDGRDPVLDAALQVLRKSPAASTAELAAAGGISRATLHRRYPRREDLLGALARRALTEVEEAFARVRATGGPALPRLVAELLPVAYDFAFLARVPDSEVADANATWAELDARLAELMADAQRRGELRPDVPPAWLATALLSLLSGASDAVEAGALAPRDVERLVLTTLVDGLAGERS